MNILFISSNSPKESIGGIERYLTNLIQYCQIKTRFNVFLMLPDIENSYSEQVGNMTIYYENSLSLSRSTGNHQKEISEKSHAFSDAVKRIIIEDKIDIICAENFHLGLPAAYSILLNMIAGFHKVPLVLQLHSFAVTELQVELINQLMWNHISSVSKSVSGDCFNKGANIEILSTDYLGVDTREFNTTKYSATALKTKLEVPQETKIILAATRIILGRKPILKQKGLVNLVEAFSKLSPRFPHWKLLIAVGKPPDALKNEFNNSYQTLLGYIKLHNIENSTIIKMFKLEEMPEVYRGSDLFVLPSENETFGQVYVEAMASGIPVIGTNVGGIPEIISDSYNGYLVLPEDSSILAQKIEEILTDEQLRTKFVTNGLKTVAEKFTAEKQFPIYFELLEQIVKASKVAPQKKDPQGVYKVAMWE